MILYHSNNKKTSVLGTAVCAYTLSAAETIGDDQRFNSEFEAGLGYIKHWVLFLCFLKKDLVYMKEWRLRARNHVGKTYQAHVAKARVSQRNRRCSKEGLTPGQWLTLGWLVNGKRTLLQIVFMDLFINVFQCSTLFVTFCIILAVF